MEITIAIQKNLLLEKEVDRQRNRFNKNAGSRKKMLLTFDRLLQLFFEEGKSLRKISQLSKISHTAVHQVYHAYFHPIILTSIKGEFTIRELGKQKHPEKRAYSLSVYRRIQQVTRPAEQEGLSIE